MFAKQETRKTPVYENEDIKFIDYSYNVEPPELGLFNWITFRIFGTEKSMVSVKSLLVTYSIKRLPEIEKMIRLVDELAKIYGPESSGYAELRPHEIDMLEKGLFWSGRSWFINQHHGLQNTDDPEQRTLYWVNLGFDSVEGLSLSVLGFHDMQVYHLTKDI